MKRLFSSLAVLSMMAVLAVGFTGCTEDDDNPVNPSDPEVNNPTNLRAYSDDGSVGLIWTPSVDETETNFGGYTIKVYDIAAQDTMTYTANAGNGAIVGGLTNGTRYKFHVYGSTTRGKLSSSYSAVIWAPAERQILDAQGNVIKVYATTSSSKPSGIDVYNPDGRAEVIMQSSPTFASRGDLYVDASSPVSPTLDIKAPQTATANPGPVTEFSTVVVDANNLSGHAATAPPDANTYTKTTVSVATGAASTGKMFFGRLVRPNNQHFYFRMLVLNTNGILVQGSGDDRYVELEFSYQTDPNNQYAKRVN